MKLTRKQLKKIIQEEINKITKEGWGDINDPYNPNADSNLVQKEMGMQIPQGEDILDMIDDSQPGDLIYYGMSGLRKMQAAVEKELGETENEYRKFHDGDVSWAEDNIVPLQQMHDKITQAMKDAIDMGFGEV